MKLGYGSFLHAYASLRGTVPDPVAPTHADLRYRDAVHPGVEPLADVYLPAKPTGASVVLVHGGAFFMGHRRMLPVRFLASRLTDAGIAACAINYRLIFRGGRLDEALADVTDALGFWRRRTASYGLDPGRISLIGLSAGATLSMLATARADLGVSKLVGCFGLYDVDHLRGRVSTMLPRVLFRSPDRAVWDARSPIRAGHPPVPTLLLHGDDDGIVPVIQTQRLADARQALGLPTRVVIYPGAPHGFFNTPSPARDAGLREILDHVT